MSRDTGHGASAVLSSTAYAFCWTEMDMGEETIPTVNISCLSTTDYEELIPGDLKEPGTVTIPFFNDPEDAAPTLGTVETLTITLPISDSANTTAATWTGTGFLTNYKRPRFVKNEPQDGSLTFQFDGLTGPTFTVEAA